VTPAADVHQHLWPDPLLVALARRSRTPLIRRSGDGWVLRIDGEPEWPIDLRDHDPVRRAALVAEDGLDEAWVALSSPLGVEALPPDEAAELIAAHHDGVRALPAGLRPWASAGVAAPDPRALGAALDEGFVGLVLPAAALSGPGGIELCAPLLGLLEERSAPLLVHPGPAPWAPPSPAGAGLPPWWPALTYIDESSCSSRSKFCRAITAMEGPAPDRNAPSTSASSSASTSSKSGTMFARAGWCQRSRTPSRMRS